MPALRRPGDRRRPRATHDRGDDEPQCVDQPGGQQGLAGPSAAVDLKFPAGLPLQLGDLGRDIAGQDRGRIPARHWSSLWEATYLGRPFKMLARGIVCDHSGVSPARASGSSEGREGNAPASHKPGARRAVPMNFLVQVRHEPATPREPWSLVSLAGDSPGPGRHRRAPGTLQQPASWHVLSIRHGSRAGVLHRLSAVNSRNRSWMRSVERQGYDAVAAAMALRRSTRVASWSATVPHPS